MGSPASIALAAFLVSHNLPAPDPFLQDMLRENPEVIGEYGALLESWCRDIERYLEEGLDQAIEKEPGPRGELDPRSVERFGKERPRFVYSSWKCY